MIISCGAIEGESVEPVDLTEFESPGQNRPPHSEWAKAEVISGRDGGELTTGVIRAPLELATDWEAILIGFGLDPSIFEIVDDTVRMSRWQQSARIASGDRDIVWLYSYKARFRRRPPRLTDVDLAAISKRISKWKAGPPQIANTGAPCTFVVCWADWQLGKSEGGGPEATIERIEESYQMTVARLAELRNAGRNIEHVAVINMGDPTEGCFGNYPSQLFTVKMTRRAQLNLCLDCWERGLEMIRPDTFVSTLCNHGEWARNNQGKSITSDSDNAGGYLADELRRIFKRSDQGPKEWLIPHDEMVQMITLSGLSVALTHGHKIASPAKELEWLRGQSIRLLREYGHEPRLWITAHRHHFRADDFGPWWRFQCPSLDGGSKWFADLSGMWATPGTLTLLVGEHDPRGWSDLAVLGTVK
jgi:hypothetical protein